MARVKLTEYAAKSLLTDGYAGIAITLSTRDEDIARLDANHHYIIKVDQGVKKRGKQGLIRLDVTKETAKQAVEELAAKGFTRFIAEEMVPHAAGDEQYLSIERLRGGFRILHSTHGGVDIEDSPESITQYDTISHVPLPQAFLTHLIEAMDREHCSFVEINPLLVRGDSCLMLDAAVLVDSAADWQTGWSAGDIVEMGQKTESEQTIASLNEGSPASFSFRVLNSNAPIWLLLSGGGASITIADEAANRGKADFIGNYGEYSGGPSREETQLYTEAVIQQLYLSSAPKKAIVIAGGVANFTDVRKTFLGIMDALTIHAPRLREMGVKVFVRRGGPNEKEGLKLMKEFLESQDMYGSIHGSADVLTVVVDEALEYVDV